MGVGIWLILQPPASLKKKKKSWLIWLAFNLFSVQCSVFICQGSSPDYKVHPFGTHQCQSSNIKEREKYHGLWSSSTFNWVKVNLAKTTQATSPSEHCCHTPKQVLSLSLCTLSLLFVHIYLCLVSYHYPPPHPTPQFWVLSLSHVEKQLHDPDLEMCCCCSTRADFFFSFYCAVIVLTGTVRKGNNRLEHIRQVRSLHLVTVRKLHQWEIAYSWCCMCK